MGSFLQEMFLRFSGAFTSWDGEEEAEQTCSGDLSRAVDHVVDETDSRLRALPGYSRRLKGPVATTFRYVDALVEDLPGAVRCSRSTFAEDSRVNAFFVNPGHLQEVFSRSAQVLDLLESRPEADECWAFLCMRKEERRQLGMSLVGDAVHRDVMQTAVSFTDHRVIAPGASEAEARRSLKCCIVNGLLRHIREREDDKRARIQALEIRLRSMRRRAKQSVAEQGGASSERLQGMIDDLEREIARGAPRRTSLEDHLDFVASVLATPEQYLSGSASSICLNRLGIKKEGGCTAVENKVPLYEIQVASDVPRVATLVRFPRAELLPRQDFVRNADLFLAL